MRQQLEQLRRLSQALEPGPEQREAWTDEVTAHARDFLAALPSRPAFQFTADEGKGILTGIPEQPCRLGSLLQQLAEHVEAPGVKLGSPGFMAFIPISSLYPAALADYLAAVINPFSGNFFASPGAVRLEHLLTRWMADFVGYPAGAAGDLTSGGSMSNLTAVVAAREARQLKARDFDKAVVYVSSQTHHSISKALRIAGLGECIRCELPLDDHFRMQPESLESAIREDRKGGLLPWLVVASAGSTDTGAVDPLGDSAAIAHEHGLWLHADGAYGAMFALCAEGKRILGGIEQSDSLTLDPHKGLFMPCGLGAVLVRDGHDLLRAYHYDAAYMQDRAALASLSEVSPSELSPELTRPFRGLRLWLSLNLLGVAAFRAALEEKLLLARHFHDQIQRVSGFETGPAPALSVVVFRFVPRTGEADEFNRRLLSAVQHDGRIFLTSTRLSGQVWLRLAVLCAATHLEQIELALEILNAKARELER